MEEPAYRFAGGKPAAGISEAGNSGKAAGKLLPWYSDPFGY